MKLNKDTGVSNIFSDMLFTVLFMVIVSFVLAILLINPISKEEGNIIKRAEYFIEMEWPDDIDCDVDLWVKGPDKGKPISFLNLNNKYMHLERDDQGVASDTGKFGQHVVTSQENREVWTLRGMLGGEYIVNGHLYKCNGSTAYDTGVPVTVPVKLRVVKINRYKIVHTVKVVFEMTWQEKTFVRFRLDNDGFFVNQGNDFMPIVKLGQGSTLR